MVLTVSQYVISFKLGEQVVAVAGRYFSWVHECRLLSSVSLLYISSQLIDDVVQKEECVIMRGRRNGRRSTDRPT